MKTLFNLCDPRDDVLTGAVKESEIAADLAQVLRRQAPIDAIFRLDTPYSGGKTHALIALSHMALGAAAVPNSSSK